MNNELTDERRQPFDRSNLRFHNYTVTLLDEAYRSGKLDERRVDDIRASVTEALDEAIDIFTLGESSSVMTETANSLLQSVLFCTDAYLMSMSCDDAIKLLATVSFKEIYTRGMKQVKRLVCESASLLVKVRRSRVNVPCGAYNELLDRRVTAFLKSYNIATNAHIAVRFDYKTALPTTNLRGIHYVKCDLGYVLRENSFMKAYDEREICYIFKYWCSQHIQSPSDADVNLFRITYICALFADYLKKEHVTLRVTYSECRTAEKLLGTFDEGEISDILRSTASHLVYGDPDYNKKALELMLPELVRALKNGNLSSVLPFARDDEIIAETN